MELIHPILMDNKIYNQKKLLFYNQTVRLKKNTIQSQLQQPLSTFQINAGTIIPANLVTPINSDLPGHIIAKVRRNVYRTRQQW